MRRALGALTAGALALLVVATGCSKNSGETGKETKTVEQQGGISKNPADSQGPAQAASGATKGGIISVMQQKDYEHLDPAQIYVSNGQVFGGLFLRTLTGYKENGDGKLLLVGDLATDAGKDLSNGKCTKWQYTLKDGVKYQDGTAITAADIAYGIGRSFSPDISNGPHYIQTWLADSNDYNASYKGPFNGGAAVPPGMEVKDSKTLVFNFKHPHCELPFAAGMDLTAPVPKAKDTGPQLYDITPFASGPYKIAKHTPNAELTLDRNPYWDPKTDPLRTANPDGFKMIFSNEDLQASQLMVADHGDQQTAVSWQRVPPAVLPQVENNPDVEKRLVQGATDFVWYLHINNQRIKDVNVRRALNYALDKQGALQTLGGSTQGTVASTLESPTTIGFKKYNAYPAPATGDVKKAQGLLKGKHPQIVYAYRNTALQGQMATAVQQSLQRAGFQVVLKPIDQSQAYTIFGRKDNQFDLYMGGWGSDWPSGSTIVPPLEDGSTITPTGNQNQDYFNNSAINQKIAQIQAEPSDKAPADWAALDQEIMTKYAPCIPFYYDKYYRPIGSKVGGTYLSAAYGLASLWKVYVKK